MIRRGRHRRRGSWQRGWRVTAGASALVALTAAAVVATVALWGGGDSPVNVACGTVDGVRSCGGLLPAAAGVSTRLHLQRATVPAGSDLQGTLVVDNTTGRSLRLTHHGCRPHYLVVVSSATYRPRYGFASSCDAHPLVLAPGRNALAVTVATTYLGCSPGASAAPYPRCAAGGQPPPLPPGSYVAVLVGSGLALPAPPPVAVRLVAAVTSTPPR